MSTSGSWSTVSKDKRWVMNGTTEKGVRVSACRHYMFDMPVECEQAIEIKKSELGEDSPKDLDWNYKRDGY